MDPLVAEQSPDVQFLDGGSASHPRLATIPTRRTRRRGLCGGSFLGPVQEWPAGTPWVRRSFGLPFLFSDRERPDSWRSSSGANSPPLLFSFSANRLCPALRIPGTIPHGGSRRQCPPAGSGVKQGDGDFRLSADFPLGSTLGLGALAAAAGCRGRNTLGVRTPCGLHGLAEEGVRASTPSLKPEQDHKGRGSPPCFFGLSIPRSF